MSPEQQIDRSVLAGKDRDELHTIAGAIGVKAATRMRKADLIEAILNAANGGDRAARAPSANGDAAAPRPAGSARPVRRRSPTTTPSPRSRRKEDALGADGDADDEMPMPRPRARRAAPDAAEHPNPPRRPRSPTTRRSARRRGATTAPRTTRRRCR